jgi:RimJ/RimL family protein N-acetyltransferase
MHQDAPGDVHLRNATEADLPIFYEQQLDPDARYMAAFTAKDPADRAAFFAHWARLLGDPAILNKTIIVNGQVAGYVASFTRLGEPEVSYWLGREYWGRGIATRALSELLRHVLARPVYARVAKDNLASRRVLEKCGFLISGEDSGFANARGQEIEEFIFARRA